MTHLRRVQHDLLLVVVVLVVGVMWVVVLRHGVMLRLVRLVGTGWCWYAVGGAASVVKRGSVVVVMVLSRGIITVRLMALLGRMRVLCRVTDIVVPYPVVARQRVSETSVPPERTALDGRRALGRKNWNLQGAPRAMSPPTDASVVRSAVGRTVVIGTGSRGWLNRVAESEPLTMLLAARDVM